jgi:hypothetical protein
MFRNSSATNYGYRGFNETHGITGRSPVGGKWIDSPDNIPTMWADQVQPMGRSQKGTIFFKGKTIYSFRSSWPLATITDRKAPDGRTIVLVNLDRDSVTTNQQAWQVRNRVTYRSKDWCMVITSDTSNARRAAEGDAMAAFCGVVANLAEKLLEKAESFITPYKFKDTTRDERIMALRADHEELVKTCELLGVSYPEGLSKKLAEKYAQIHAAFDKFEAGADKREKARIKRAERACIYNFKKNASAWLGASWHWRRGSFEDKIDAAIVTALQARPEEFTRYWRAFQLNLTMQEVDKSFEARHPHAREVLQAREVRKREAEHEYWRLTQYGRPPRFPVPMIVEDK